MPKPNTASINTSMLAKESDPSLRLCWVDTLEAQRREDPALVTLRFFTALPERLCEACRVQTSVTHVKGMIDALARLLDHYPIKPK